MECKEARKEMLIKITMINANSTAKTTLRSLPLNPQPTLGKMIEAGVKHNLTENAVAQAVAQVIAQGVSGVFAIVAVKENQRCSSCGNYGHFMIKCPQKRATKDHNWLHENPNR